MNEKTHFGGRPPLEPLKVEELKKLGRKRIIEMAVEAAEDTGSTMIPKDFKEVKVLVGPDNIFVELARGTRAYDYDGGRRIEGVTLSVRFTDQGLQIGHEGSDLLTDGDRRVLEFVLKSMPPDYHYISITITDNPGVTPEGYTVELEGDNAMGRHSVDRKTGVWTYVTHKQYACDPDGPEGRYVEMKN